jgi:hypothetical protein
MAVVMFGYCDGCDFRGGGGCILIAVVDVVIFDEAVRTAVGTGTVVKLFLSIQYRHLNALVQIFFLDKWTNSAFNVALEAGGVGVQHTRIVFLLVRIQKLAFISGSVFSKK